LIGRTDGGRYLTMVIEQTAEPTSWLIVTGWPSTNPSVGFLAAGHQRIPLGKPRSSTRRVRRRPRHHRSSVCRRHRGNPDAKVRVVVSIEGEDAKRLQRVSAARGETPGQLIAELLRDADPSAA
jgi:hypothetical protein